MRVGRTQAQAQARRALGEQELATAEESAGTEGKACIAAEDGTGAEAQGGTAAEERGDIEEQGQGYIEEQGRGCIEGQGQDGIGEWERVDIVGGIGAVAGTGAGTEVGTEVEVPSEEPRCKRLKSVQH